MAEQPDQAEPLLKIEGYADRFSPHEDHDDYLSAGQPVQPMNEEQKQALIGNTTKSDIMPATMNIKYCHAAHCYLADPDYGKRIAEALSLLDMELQRRRHRMPFPHKRAMQATKAGT